MEQEMYKIISIKGGDFRDKMFSIFIDIEFKKELYTYQEIHTAKARHQRLWHNGVIVYGDSSNYIQKHRLISDNISDMIVNMISTLNIK